MTEQGTQQDSDKAEAFFSRASQAAKSNRFDYAIDMYLEGLRCAPDALEQGHIPLRELAFLRQERKGKRPSLMEKVKYSRSKTPLEQMINAEYLFAKDPDNLHYAHSILKAAIAAGYSRTIQWLANLLFEANHSSAKPSAQTYILIKDAYSAIGQYKRALTACQFAAKIRSDDSDLADECKRLSAELAVSKGKYDMGGDFRKSIKNRELQTQLQAQEGVVKSDSFRASVINKARKEFAKDPQSPVAIFNLAKALADSGNDNEENEAIKLLEDAFNSKNDFSFKQRAGRIKISQLKRKVRQSRAKLEANPGDDEIRAESTGLISRLKKTELEHYQACVENYPTDLHLKYEYAIRLVQNERYDEAIPLFQDSQKDPRHKIASMSKIGLCFYNKEWYSDAIDVYRRAIDAHELKDDEISKEMRYNLARCYEQQNEIEKAVDLYRKLAQLDFAYKDVRQRVDRLRNIDQ